MIDSTFKWKPAKVRPGVPWYLAGCLTYQFIVEVSAKFCLLNLSGVVEKFCLNFHPTFFDLTNQLLGMS